MQGLPSSQTKALPDLQAPLLQTSATVQTLPSSQGALLLTLVQPPAGSQPSVVQGFPSSHRLGLLATQAPALQASPVVQLLLSSHLLVLLACLQPCWLSQLSSVHGLPSSQPIAAPGLQAPSPHLSPTVQMLPSSQGNVLLANTQPNFPSQLSVVQGFLSSHTLALPGTQLPPLQASPTVQSLPSLQLAVLATVMQPLPASQLSSVQGLPSSQVADTPDLQTLFWQTSPSVQTLLSLHGKVLAK